MLTSFVLSLSLALAAPVPPPAPPVAGGPLPRLLELKGDADGKIMVTVMRTEVQKITVTTAGPNGAPVTSTREVPVTKMTVVELGDVKDLKVTTADGKKVDVADAVKALKGGATVVSTRFNFHDLLYKLPWARPEIFLDRMALRVEPKTAPALAGS